MKTKTLLLICALCLSIGIWSCDQLTNAADVKFAFDGTDFSFSYGPDTVTGNLTFIQQNIKNELDSVCQKEGVNLSKLKSVKLTGCTLTITDPSGANFNAVSSFSAKLSTSTLAEVEVAALNPVPANTNVINLVSTPQELIDYLKASNFSFNLHGNKTAAITQKLTIKVHLSYEVTANPL